MSRFFSGKRFTQLVLAVLASSLLAGAGGCAGRRPPVLEPLRDRVDRVPVVVLPGITGTRLRDRETGRMAWGNARAIFLPRDGGYALARPIDPATEDRLEAFSPVIRFRILGLIRVDIYASLIRLLEANGYRLGDLGEPRPGDTLFLFPYDWRDSNVRAARELAGRLRELRRSRGNGPLQVDLICQSNAARIARWLIKYGDASLEQAEAGATGPPAGIRVRKLILVGADNGGGLGTLEDLHRGRRYVPLVGRRFRPETAFTFPSVYEALPAHREDLFVDGAGRPLDVDLFDAASWQRHGWSIYRPETQRRVVRKRRPDLFGDPVQRRAFLARSLDRARRLHHLLARDVPEFAAADYYVIQNAYHPTDERAVLERHGDGFRTFFGEDKRVKRDAYLSTVIRGPGDGHATIESQFWLSPQERAALARPPAIVPELHRKIILHPAAHRWILEFLLD